MKVQVSQTAPGFNVNDINGKAVDLRSYKGKKVLLSFYRNAGCPICNLRFHELQSESDYFKSKNLVLISVYESTAENMKKYIENENFYAVMISDPSQSLYGLYHIERSTAKLMKGMFHGAMGKVKAGKKLFKSDIKTDGNANRIGADFLIDENGKVVKAYYGKYLGDELPLAEIKRFLK